MLHQQIKSTLKEAMMAKDEIRLSVIRGLLSAFTNELVNKGRTPQDMLEDDEVIAVISRATKQRKDSIKQFTDGGRPELAEPEQAELDILLTYLPAQLSREEVQSAVNAKIAELGITDKTGVATLMRAMMADLKGKVDGNMVKEVVESSLQ